MAQSAARAGLTAHVADLFGDRDTRETARTVVVDGSPQSWKDFLASTPADQPWMYGGGFENQYRLVDELRDLRYLLGTEPHGLAESRIPWRVQEPLPAAGFPCMQIFKSGRGLSRDGIWLRKSMYSTGGHGVSIWDESNDQPEFDRYAYFQRRMDAPVHSGLYVASERGCRLVGVTRQLEGCEWLHAKRYHYCGSIGPLNLEPHEVDDWTRLGEVLARRFALRGIFGVDCLITRFSRSPSVIDLNPRYVASAELYEHVGEPSLIAQHIMACLGDFAAVEPTSGRLACAKGILYARDELFVDETLSDHLFAGRHGEMVRYADIPNPGTPIPAGDPILTIIVGPMDEEQQRREPLAERLRREAEALERLIYER